MLLLPTPQVPTVCPDKAVNKPTTQPCEACFRYLLFPAVCHGQDNCRLGGQRQSNLSGQTDIQPNVSISTADTPGGTSACQNTHTHRHMLLLLRAAASVNKPTTDAHHTHSPNMHALQQHLFPLIEPHPPTTQQPLLITTTPLNLDQTNHSNPPSCMS